ncbi:MAG: hypothetical protein QM831_11975 [Kofleriaceae bacterium]
MRIKVELRVARESIPTAVARDGGPSPFAARRKRGALLIVGGLALGVALVGVLVLLERVGLLRPRYSEYTQGNVLVQKTQYSPIWVVPLIVPLFTTLIGSAQLITGRSMGDLANAYQTMSGFGRFVVSVLVVAVALAIIGCIVAIVLSFLI